MADTGTEKVIADFRAWLEAQSLELADIENAETIILQFMSSAGSSNIKDYIGDVASLRQSKVHEQLTDEIRKYGVKTKNKKESSSDLLERYRTVPLHAIFLYTSEDKVVADYILDNWGALDSLSGDFCDIHPSVDQFENIEDAYDLIERLDILRNSNFNTYSQLPGLFFWDMAGSNAYIPFGAEVTQANLKQIVRTVFEEIRKKPELSSVTRAKNKIEDKTMSSKNKLARTSIWSDILAFLLTFVVIIGSLVLVSQWVSPLLLGIVFIAAILVFLLISALALRRQRELSEANFMVLVKEVIKRLPLLRQISNEEKYEKDKAG